MLRQERGKALGYPLHPFTAHFPIALLLTASALELLALRRGGVAPSETTRLLLRIGWWAALLALATGTVDLVRQLSRVQEALGWVNTHVGLSLVILFIYSRLAFRSTLSAAERRRLHLLGSALILATGLIGGHMVYSLEFGR